MNARAAVLFLAAAIASLATNAQARPRVDTGVHRALRQHGSVNLMITMKSSNRRALESVSGNTENTFTSRGAKIEHLVETLEAHASASHGEVLKVLSQESTSEQPLYARYEKFWISNQIYIEAASFELVEKLVQLSSIDEVREEAVIELDTQLASVALSASNSSSASGGGNDIERVEWGVEQIGAPQLWAKGFTGQGVVVGSIDSGVRGTHETLASNFRGLYGWYAPPYKQATPSDANGHGTHTMGTIAGGGGIGVAPGVQWMSCRGCPSALGLCIESYMLTCAQFLTCPTDTNGENRDCSKAPHIINNSWTTERGRAVFNAAVVWPRRRRRPDSTFAVGRITTGIETRWLITLPMLPWMGSGLCRCGRRQTVRRCNRFETSSTTMFSIGSKTQRKDPQQLPGTTAGRTISAHSHWDASCEEKRRKRATSPHRPGIEPAPAVPSTGMDIEDH